MNSRWAVNGAMAYKRGFDLTVGVVAAVLLVPVLVAVALGVRIALGRPILFRQQRPGYPDGRPFMMYKFRTMREEFDSNGQPRPDHERMTAFGSFLRKSSLDELPELWNVLRGDMSLVGPRPLLMEYLPLYTPEQALRHQVRPGVTGWAQVNGRNEVAWEERLAMDVWYVKNRTLWLDIKILFATAIKVFKREGISQHGHVTMEKFRGSAS